MATTVNPEHFPAYKAAYHALDAAIRDPKFDRNERKLLQEEHYRTRDLYTSVWHDRQAADRELLQAIASNESQETIDALQATWLRFSQVAKMLLDLDVNRI